MNEFRKNGGTVIIVSHNLQAIRNICKKVLWLNNGKIKENGEVHHICNLYEADIVVNSKSDYCAIGSQLNYDSTARILKIGFLDNNDQKRTILK